MRKRVRELQGVFPLILSSHGDNTLEGRRDFLGGLVVRIWHFHCCGLSLVPGQETDQNCVAWPKKKNNRKIISSSHPVLLLKNQRPQRTCLPSWRKFLLELRALKSSSSVFLLIFLTILWVAVMNISFAYSQTEIICYMLILMMRLCLGLLSWKQCVCLRESWRRRHRKAWEAIPNACHMRIHVYLH